MQLVFRPMSEAAGPGQRTVGLTVYAPNRFGTLVFDVPQGDPLSPKRTSRRSPPPTGFACSCTSRSLADSRPNAGRGMQA